jgi:uncharacterized protein YdaU (DUF1376 family)
LGEGFKLKTLPYFKWFPADAETDGFYSSLTQEERGVYHTCLNSSWINDGIPANLDDLAVICRMPRKAFDKAWAKVGKKWTPSRTDGDKLVNQRQEVERESAKAKSENNKRVGNANASKSRVVRESNDPQHAHMQSVVVSSENKETTLPPVLEFAEYPLTAAAIRTRFPSANLILVNRIVDASARQFISVDSPRIPVPDDAVFAEAVDEACKDGRKTGAGLLLRTVPSVIESWAKYGRKSPDDGLTKWVKC